jgi:hypothetical protein
MCRPEGRWGAGGTAVSVLGARRRGLASLLRDQKLFTNLYTTQRQVFAPRSQ